MYQRKEAPFIQEIEFKNEVLADIDIVNVVQSMIKKKLNMNYVNIAHNNL